MRIAVAQIEAIKGNIEENINKSFFKGKLDVIENKGTLQLLEEWLTNIFKIEGEGSISEVIKPFKTIRKERQAPAHKITENIYDIKLIEKQKNIISKAYNSMRQLRNIFHLHPKARKNQIPEWLENGKIINI